jgi:hypothetical protein
MQISSVARASYVTAVHVMFDPTARHDYSGTMMVVPEEAGKPSHFKKPLNQEGSSWTPEHLSVLPSQALQLP